MELEDLETSFSTESDGAQGTWCTLSDLMGSMDWAQADVDLATFKWNITAAAMGLRTLLLD